VSLWKFIRGRSDEYQGIFTQQLKRVENFVGEIVGIMM